MKAIPERTEKSAAGLEAMCKYVIQALIFDYMKAHPMERFIGDEFRMAEIGVWTGAGTKIFSKYFSRVFAVDPWAPGVEITAEYDPARAEEIFDGRFIGNGRVIKMKLPSLDAARTFEDGSLDMVYIDAIHAYVDVKADIKTWIPKVRRGGFVCGHDYERRFPGVIRAVDEFRGANRKTFTDTSWAARIC